MIRANCESYAKQHLSVKPFIQRADTQKLRTIFNKYSSKSIDNENFMTSEDFIVNYLGLYEKENYNKESVRILANVVDTSKDQLISFEEFLAFERILCSPDALYATAFQMFDASGDGYVTFNYFKQIIEKTTINSNIPFDFKSKFINLYFGKNRNRHINYSEFTQILHDFHEEHARQAFNKFDKNETGSILAIEFNHIMIVLLNHLLTPFVKENLVAVAMEGEHSKRVTFPYFQAFISLLNNIETIKRIYQTRSRHNNKITLTKEEFLNETQIYTQITPLEIDILFQLNDIIRKDGLISYKEIEMVAPIKEQSMIYHHHARAIQDTIGKQSEKPGDRSTLIGILENVYRFALGSLAGALGATAVYPIDLVKTRMQNQRSGSMVGEIMYINSWDCFKKVLRFEGFFGLYRGLPPQIVGVAPEKAIKLTVNDLLKDMLTNKDNEISILSEIIAGGCAGASQVVFTNPLEIVKIRLQVAGEIASTQRVSAISVIRDLGLFGLYKGAKACFLRDIPFSSIYFPAYSNLKKAFADENGVNSPLSLLSAATLAGMPAASLVTPADVIKTRLQVVARTGQTQYSGLFDAARKIYTEEGGRAFWKGTVARVCRSSPQFGVTLLSYEMLQRYLSVDFGGRKLSGTESGIRIEEMQPVNVDHIGGYKMARLTFEGLESKFGLAFPKYKLS